MNIFNITVDEAHEYLIQQNSADLLSVGLNEEIPPKWDDLVRLYKLIRDRKPFQILEFGSGFSTVVMAHALKQNWNDYLALHGINTGGWVTWPTHSRKLFQWSRQKNGATIKF